MEIGIDSFAASGFDPETNSASIDPAQRLNDLVDEIATADRAGLDVFGVGEHHRAEFLDSAPTIILAAAAARTARIRLTSAVTVLSAADPVRVFQQFATLDLLSRGRAEIVAGRGSFVEAFPLFGLALEDYDELYAEKLALLLQLRASACVTWKGQYRPALDDAAIYPRPLQAELPIWVGVGGTPQSFARAGVLGLPLMVAIIGGQPKRFRPLVDLYRNAYARAGHPPERMRVGLHIIGFVGESDDDAAETYFPGWQREFTRVGRERGWGPVTREQFDELRAPGGAFLVGSPATVVEKIRAIDRDLGGVARINLQMTVAHLPHPKMLRAIELLGSEVAPLVR